MGLTRDLAPLLASQDQPAPEGWAEQLSAYLNLLVEANRRVNLVSRKSIGDVVAAQVVPSLAALLVVPDAELRALDVGAGGGFPGIPLAILRPRAQVDLVESARKKCDFLQLVRQSLRLENVRVHHCRVERPTEALARRAPFDVALARAVGTPRELATHVHPLLRPGSRLWVFVAPTGAAGQMPWPRDRPVTALVPAALRRE